MSNWLWKKSGSCRTDKITKDGWENLEVQNRKKINSDDFNRQKKEISEKNDRVIVSRERASLLIAVQNMCTWIKK